MTDPEFIDLRPFSRDRPGTIGVAALEAQTRALRAVDYRSGGGMCRDAVMARIHHGHEMLKSSFTEPVKKRLFTAVADLHNLAGWTCFDSGHVGAAHHHLDLALELATRAGNDDLVANIHYRRGRFHLHYGAADEALAQFQLGRLAVRRSGSKLAACILSANQAWAYAKKHDAKLAIALIDRAYEEFGENDDPEPGDWARFYTETDMSAMAGSVHIDLALRDGEPHIELAITSLTEAVGNYGPEMARSRSLCLIMLATGNLLDGDTGKALSLGCQSIYAAETLKSVRIRDRLRPLRQAAAKRRENADCRALSEAITAFVTSPNHT
jgi:tetratricopeptide (TPR) repeat protein